MKLINISGNTFYLRGATNTGVYLFDDSSALIIDPGLSGIRIDKLISRKDDFSGENLSCLESDDDFIQYLIELSSRGDREYNIAMEELSSSDLEDIRRSIGKTPVAVVDGLSDSR